MWIPILITVLALCMVVGPVMMMQPNTAQKRLMQRRDLAMRLGMRVHLVPVPAGVKASEGTSQLAMYCRPWRSAERSRIQWQLSRRGYAHGMHFCEHWDWEGAPDQSGDAASLTAARLARLPESVLAIGAGPQGLCCYWEERGGDERVEAIAAWLAELAGLLEPV